jgi:thiosulfate/3-mercaptopyruvate sulfurtransferase
MFTSPTRCGRTAVGDGSAVVVYDDDGGMFAARLWWLLRYAGFDAARVLDGGFSAWTGAGLPVVHDVPDYDPAPLTLRLRPAMVASMAEVQAKRVDANVKLFDARAPERYRGEVEPLDKKAGHIPGAINKPFAENLERGRFKSPDALRDRFAEAEAAEEVILYCGSGVSAAHNALALEEAGVKGAKLYVGSWSDWSSHDENPVATGDDDSKFEHPLPWRAEATDPTPNVRKAFAYITRSSVQEMELLVFAHTDPELGIQVPKGTVEAGETPAEAALREGLRRDGLNGARADALPHHRYGALSDDPENYQVQNVTFISSVPPYKRRNAGNIRYVRVRRQRYDVHLFLVKNRPG